MKMWPFPLVSWGCGWGSGVFCIFFSRRRNQKSGGKRGANSAEEWATAGLVLAKTLNFHWLEAWPEAFCLFIYFWEMGGGCCHHWTITMRVTASSPKNTTTTARDTLSYTHEENIHTLLNFCTLCLALRK